MFECAGIDASDGHAKQSEEELINKILSEGLRLKNKNKQLIKQLSDIEALRKKDKEEFELRSLTKDEESKKALAQAKSAQALELSSLRDAKDLELTNLNKKFKDLIVENADNKRKLQNLSQKFDELNDDHSTLPARYEQQIQRLKADHENEMRNLMRRRTDSMSDEQRAALLRYSITIISCETCHVLFFTCIYINGQTSNVGRI